MGTGIGDLYPSLRPPGEDSSDPLQQAPSKERIGKQLEQPRVQSTFPSKSSTELPSLNSYGHFGNKGRSRNVRVIKSKDPVADARAMYESLKEGGVEKTLPGGKGYRAVFDDGISVVFREQTSTPNSPAIEIQGSSSSMIRDQKIHFLESDAT